LKKVCFITPGHISSNPRLIKEALALSNVGYKVHIIFTQYMDYLIREDVKILQENPSWTYDNLIWLSSNKMLRLKSFLIQKLAEYIFPSSSARNFLINRNFYWQLRMATRIKADLYIGHNLGALPVAVKAAQSTKSKCGFDAEDFHRNEITNDSNNSDFKLKKFIEDKYLKEIDYLSAASPLIAKAYQNLYPDISPVTINNVFEIKYQPEINLKKHKELKLFWFSQTIGKGRGLEEVIAALNVIKNPLIELHLLGSSSIENKRYFDEMYFSKIIFHPSISNNDIFPFTRNFDVGLATELKYPFNRDICLTNKLFTYLVSGLAIVASDTKAQTEFMAKNNNVGRLYQSGNTNELVNILNEIFVERDLLDTHKKNAYKLAQSKYNWEKEQQKFLSLINDQI